MIRVFVIGDVHGQHKVLQQLLDKADITPNDEILQIGDLCNCVESSIDNDLRCLDIANEYNMILLVGNHEHPYFGGNKFYGFWWNTKLEKTIRSRIWFPSSRFDDVLITHAGVTPYFADVPDVKEMNLSLLERWVEDPTDEIFNAIGFARSSNPHSSGYGGIFWSDWEEPKTSYYNQIIGHTPQRDGNIKTLKNHNNKWCMNIDVGVKWKQDNLAGVWLTSSPDGVQTEIVQV